MVSAPLPRIKPDAGIVPRRDGAGPPPATRRGTGLPGIARNAIDSSIAPNILGGIGGIIIGGSAMAHLNALGVTFFSRI